MEADHRFITIVYTMPEPAPHEAQAITAFLQGGITRVHLRHPDMDAAMMARILHNIPSELHRRITIHNHFSQLLALFPELGVHINSHAPVAPSLAACISRSCHAVDEASQLPAGSLDYITLSPVYPSISKPGYAPAANLLAGCAAITHIPVIALGGVTPTCFPQLHRSGFRGAAMMGWAWQQPVHTSLNLIHNASIHI
ncbi:MAG: thiamine phosphate synthase [Muribaculaceae bacterium]|nr:thiamine phosphate synthase [Muribaculaceae bacterium]